MKSKVAFLSENILVSVAGHLAIVAALVTSFALMGGEIERIVASDRIVITEIDLNNIKVTADTTELYNQEKAAPTTAENGRDNAAATQQPAVAPPRTGNKNPSPADANGDLPPVPAIPAKPEPEKPADNAVNPNAPRGKTTVRVNRETLTRTMTISVVDALRAAMTRCWVIDTKRDDIAGLRIVAHLTMFDNGAVRDMWIEDAARADTDAGFAYAVQTIKSAVSVCQPFSMLPPSEFDSWKNIQLTFYPQNASVQ